MPGYTLEQAQAQLDAWMAASLAATAGQTYEIAGRRLTRQNAAEILQQIEYWSREVDLLRMRTAGRSRARTMRVI